MNVLYLRTYFNFNLKAGGSVGHTAGVINSLSKKNKVHVISNDHLPEVKTDITIIPPGKVNFGLLNNILEIFYNYRLGRVLKEKINHYDVIYHRYTGNSYIAAFLSKKYSLPLILEFNSSVVWALKNWKIKQKFPKNLIRIIFNYFIRLPYTIVIEKYNLKNATLIVVVSEVMKENLIEKGIKEEKILVNPNGVDPFKYSDKNDGREIRKKYNLQNKLVLGFIGTFGQWHGIIELVKAINIFYNKYPENIQSTKFLLIGDGILMPDVKKIISNSEYQKNIILTGIVPQSDAPDYLAACDIFLSPHIPNPDGTKFFGSPTKLFEYMAMGKPIIASNLAQIGDILSHMESAYLVEPGNISELVKAMKVMVEDENLRKNLGNKTRKEVLERYTWDIHVENILKKLQEILAL
ncbi:MAG: glycosyltransferase family 4 protein [Bacteroidales bacterium]|nr:glycosyltransferase family 4 protein [Bacteroidales bacterium]